MVQLIILCYLAFVVGLMLVRSIINQHKIREYELQIWELMNSRKETLEVDMRSLLREANNTSITQ